ncbi:MAG: glycosyltransferase [Phycisphaerales bacterium]|nr:glycosyltransferase [Phycisphaerales bacterium]
MPQQHVILCTHTPLHLRRCLLGFVAQTRRADSITLSCDVENTEIIRVVEEVAREASLPIRVVQRPHTGKARCSQVRNNAVRDLLTRIRPDPGARLIFLDGDTVPSPDMVARHESLGGSRGLISTFRVNLTEEQTERFSDADLLAGRPPVELLSAQCDELKQRHKRYRRQLFWRTLGMGKSHKPRLIGGHFSVPLDAYVAVNGCDEAYEGYGQEDDDLARRLHAAGWPSIVAVREIVVYHLFHPTRAPQAWDSAPGVARFRAPAPTRAELGLDRPAPQGPMTIINCPSTPPA